MHKLVACTIAVALVGAGCGQEVTPTSALPPVTSLPSQESTSSIEPVSSPTAIDGSVSDDEAARASELIRVNDITTELLDRYGGRLTSWEPAELEGEPRGAVAMIEFPAPVSMFPKVLRVEAGSVPTRVEDYVLVTEQLGNEMVGRYIVVVDLVTMTVVHLAPTAAPPTTTMPAD